MGVPKLGLKFQKARNPATIHSVLDFSAEMRLPVLALNCTRSIAVFSSRTKKAVATTTAAGAQAVISAAVWRAPAGVSVLLSQPPRMRVIIAAMLNRSEEHRSELQSRLHVVCRLLLVKKKQ